MFLMLYCLGVVLNALTMYFVFMRQPDMRNFVPLGLVVSLCFMPYSISVFWLVCKLMGW